MLEERIRGIESLFDIWGLRGEVKSEIVKQIERRDVSGGSRPGYDAIEDASLRRISLGGWEAWDWLISDRVHLNSVPSPRDILTATC